MSAVLSPIPRNEDRGSRIKVKWEVGTGYCEGVG